MFCVLCRRLFWRDPKPAGRLSCWGPRGQVFVRGVASRSRARAVRRAAVKTRSSVRAMQEPWRAEIEEMLGKTLKPNSERLFTA